VPHAPSTAAPATPAGLRYVNDEAPGITRIARGAGFAYRDADGRIVRDRATLDRILRELLGRSIELGPAHAD
jgi:DNA topoisomerase-1